MFTKLPQAPSVPRNPVVVSIGSSWFNIQWKGSKDMGGAIATSYTIHLQEYHSAVGSAPPAPPTLTTLTIGPTLVPDQYNLYRFRLINLQAETSYAFQISVSNVIGASPFTASSDTARTNKVRRPGAPGMPFAASAGSDFIHLNWTAPEDDGGSPVDHYTIFVSDDGSTWPLTSTTTSTTASYRLDTLTASTTRWVVVRATNLAGPGPSSHVSAGKCQFIL